MSKRCLKVRYEGPRWRRLLTNISIFMKYQDGRKLIPFTSPASHPSPENLAYAPSSYFLAPWRLRTFQATLASIISFSSRGTHHVTLVAMSRLRALRKRASERSISRTDVLSEC